MLDRRMRGREGDVGMPAVCDAGGGGVPLRPRKRDAQPQHTANARHQAQLPPACSASKAALPLGTGAQK